MNFLIYCLFRSFGFVISLLPYSLIHGLGRILGSCAYYLHTPFRKKAMCNLSIAFGDQMSEEKKKKLARHSFQNVMITCLEFFKLKKSKGKLHKIVTLQERDEVFQLMQKKQGVVFLTGHQANWEIPFVAITEHFPGTAIGRPIKNKWLYRWVLSVREMNGGKIVMPKNAIRQGLKALKKGEFLGIVGDQALPESPYSYPLFGTRAWTASTPALIAYKTNNPLVVGMTHRYKNHYYISASPPLWPDLTKPAKEEVPRLMDKAMGYLEKSILKHPEQWMWIHNRWKQQGVDHVKRKYRYGFILVTLPPDPTPYLELLPILRKIYPHSFFTLYAPQAHPIEFEDATIEYYHEEKELFKRDWRFQLVFDFYNSPKLRHHYAKLGAMQTLSLAQMKKQAPSDASLEEIVTHTLVKPKCPTPATT